MLRARLTHWLYMHTVHLTKISPTVITYSTGKVNNVQGRSDPRPSCKSVLKRHRHIEACQA